MKKHIIYGIGKLQKDFQYIFNDLDIDYYIEDEEEIENTVYENTYKVSLVTEEQEDFLIYVCKRDRESALLKLENLGLSEGKDFIFAEQLFYQLDFDIHKEAVGKKIAVWGNGGSYRELLDSGRIRYEDIDIIIDNSAVGEKIVHPADIDNINDYYVIIAVKFEFYNVEQQLIEMGIESTSYISYTDVISNNSEMMKKTYFDISYGDGCPICNMPFEHISLEANGDIDSCCGSFRTGPVMGNIYTNHYSAIWNGIRAKIHRLAILNGTYSFCNGVCTFLAKKKLDKECYERYEEVKLPDTPNACTFNNDKRCNLACVMCRDDWYVPNENQRNESILLKDIAEQYIVKTNPEWVCYASCGEVFISGIYRSMMSMHKKNSDNHLFMFTNANAFTVEKFNELTKNFASIAVGVSIDAATKETYEKIRVGGDFEKVKQNLGILSEMKKTGIIKSLTMAFVIQYENVHEAKEFAYYAKSLGADRVVYTRLFMPDNWNIKEIQKNSLYDEKGKIKKQYVKYFKDEIFKDKMVDMSTAACAFDNDEFNVYNFICDYKVRDIKRENNQDLGRKK